MNAATDSELVAIEDALVIIARAVTVIADVVRDVKARELRSGLPEHLAEQTQPDADVVS